MLYYRPGEMVCSYQVQSVLGRGSFGVVLLATNAAQPHKQFALKLVPCDHFNPEVAAKARQDALSEAALLEKLRHEHVVCCHDSGWDSRRRSVWFALDFMDGGDLQTYIDFRRREDRGPAEPEFCRRVLLAMGSALVYIHSQGILHRDVKPSNMLLDADIKEIKLADFGISKILEATGLATTFVGTPYYLSPEIIRGGPYGSASDAWALGVCVYELAALQRPFQAENQLALARQIVDEAPVPLPDSCAPDVARLVLALLVKEPKKRIQLPNIIAAVAAPAQQTMQVPKAFAGSMPPVPPAPASARSKVRNGSTGPGERREPSIQGWRPSEAPEKHVGWAEAESRTRRAGHGQHDEVQLEVPEVPGRPDILRNAAQRGTSEEWSVGSSLLTEELEDDRVEEHKSHMHSGHSSETASNFGKQSNLLLETPRDPVLTGGSFLRSGPNSANNTMAPAPRSPSTLASSNSNSKFSAKSSMGRKWFRFGCLPLEGGFSEDVSCCNNGHLLHRFNAPQDTLFCSNCEQHIVKGELVWGCLTCNFFICHKCSHLESNSFDLSESTSTSSRPTAKTWYFLLPGSGCHELRAECLGQRIGGPVVYIDGVQAPPEVEGLLQYAGPGGSVLELRSREKSRQWDLLVNGITVEDYAAGKRKAGVPDDLHNVKGLSDGSYTIATQFSQDGKHLRPIRRFHFKVDGAVNELEVAHHDCVWEVTVNGIILHRRTHTYWDNRYQAELRARSLAGDPLNIQVAMEWDSWKTEWCYTLCINNVDVPFSWGRQTGHVQGVMTPEVLRADGDFT